MAIKLLAIIVVLALAQSFPHLARLRDFNRLRAWLGALAQAPGSAQTALAIAIPVLLCALLQWGLRGWMYGLLAFAFAVCVLWFCWGPRDLGEDIDAIAKAPDSDRRILAAQQLRPDENGPTLAFDAPSLVDAAFSSALKRWFGVLFWFFVLGPSGALLYRLVQILSSDSAFASAQSEAGRALARQVALLLDWLPAHLMALALAVASDFDTVLRSWRGYHDAQGKGYFSLDLGFLSAIARASVDADVIAGDGYAEDVNDPLIELADARHLLVRVLIVWLAVAALLVLGGVGR